MNPLRIRAAIHATAAYMRRAVAGTGIAPDELEDMWARGLAASDAFEREMIYSYALADLAKKEWAARGCPGSGRRWPRVPRP